MRPNVRPRILRIAAIVAVATAAIPAQTQTYVPPQHLDENWPGLVAGESVSEVQHSVDLGPQLTRGRSAKWMLADQRRLTDALSAMEKQRPGKVDAYVVSVALDSDPVFGREAREAAKVLAARYGAQGRSIVLAGTDGAGPSALPAGSLDSLGIALARVAELMDPNEDALILYVTSHGMQQGIAYHYADEGFGVLPPRRLAEMLGELGIRNRMLLLSACYSGIFIAHLAGETTAIVTAATSDRPSFGCMADNDWTFFGDALINHALRKPQPLVAAAAEARGMIGGWEAELKVQPSDPQVSIGDGVARWLAPLDAAVPRIASKPVGKPATEALRQDGGG